MLDFNVDDIAGEGVDEADDDADPDGVEEANGDADPDGDEEADRDEVEEADAACEGAEDTAGGGGGGGGGGALCDGAECDADERAGDLRTVLLTAPPTEAAPAAPGVDSAEAGRFDTSEEAPYPVSSLPTIARVTSDLMVLRSCLPRC
ncbi:MAG: hypothetical protein ACYCW6_02860 [Candidatus Xenobia bacterium]